MAGLIPFNRNRGLWNGNHFDDFTNMLDDFFGDFEPTRFIAGNTFKHDVIEGEKDYVVEAELPGIKKEELSLVMNEGKLTIEVNHDESTENKKDNYIHRERRYGAMRRCVYLSDVSEENIGAEFTDGILKVTIPKLEKKDKSLKIDIK